MRFNLIFNVTTYCNYNCSYCSVIKNKKKFQIKDYDNFLSFFIDNIDLINSIKFFGGEPLLNWKLIKQFIDDSKVYFNNKYIIVTNTSLLTEEVCLYLKRYFKIIFFSIDSENTFNYKSIFFLSKKYDLYSKLYFNLVISPGKEEIAWKQFFILYKMGFRGFNLLPVYLTKKWTKVDLQNLYRLIKKIVDLYLVDNSIMLYGFQENKGDNLKLLNNDIFVDTDLKIYYSDIVSTYFGKKIKDKLFLGEIGKCSLSKLAEVDFSSKDKIIKNMYDKVENNITGQKELRKIMDHFSLYLNKKLGIAN